MLIHDSSRWLLDAIAYLKSGITSSQEAAIQARDAADRAEAAVAQAVETPDATDIVKGKLKLTGDLGGTADAPTVPGLALKSDLGHHHDTDEIDGLTEFIEANIGTHIISPNVAGGYVITTTASASASGAVAAGAYSDAQGQDSLALSGGVARGYRSVGIGSGSDSRADNAVAVGPAIATGASSVAVGKGAGADMASAVSIGEDSNAQKNYTVAIGSSAIAGGEGATVLGSFNEATGENATALGDNLSASGDYTSVIGTYSSALMDGGIAVGNSAVSTKADAIAIGSGSAARGSSDVALGSHATSGTGTGPASNVAVGDTSTARAHHNVAIGSGADAGSSANPDIGHSSIAIGRNAGAGDLGDSATAVGYGASAKHTHSSAFGAGAQTTKPNQIVIGTPTDEILLAGTLGNPEIKYYPNITALNAVTEPEIGFADLRYEDITGVDPGAVAVFRVLVRTQWVYLDGALTGIMQSFSRLPLLPGVYTRTKGASTWNDWINIPEVVNPPGMGYKLRAKDLGGGPIGFGWDIDYGGADWFGSGSPLLAFSSYAYTTYFDYVATNGARLWRKNPVITGGLEVIEGDTGRRKIDVAATATAPAFSLEIRRINSVVYGVLTVTPPDVGSGTRQLMVLPNGFWPQMNYYAQGFDRNTLLPVANAGASISGNTLNLTGPIPASPALGLRFIFQYPVATNNSGNIWPSSLPGVQLP